MNFKRWLPRLRPPTVCVLVITLVVLAGLNVRYWDKEEVKVGWPYLAYEKSPFAALPMDYVEPLTPDVKGGATTSTATQLVSNDDAMFNLWSCCVDVGVALAALLIFGGLTEFLARRKLLRVHLATLIALNVTASVLLGLNLLNHPGIYFGLECGWPYLCIHDFKPRSQYNGSPAGFERFTGAGGMDLPEDHPLNYLDRSALLIDLGVAITILVAVWALCEFIIRRRARQNISVAGSPDAPASGVAPF